MATGYRASAAGVASGPSASPRTVGGDAGGTVVAVRDEPSDGWAASQIPVVPGSPQRLIAANPFRRRVVLVVQGGQPVWVAAQANFDNNTGFLLKDGAGLDLTTRAEVWGFVLNPSAVHVAEEFDVG